MLYYNKQTKKLTLKIEWDTDDIKHYFDYKSIPTTLEQCEDILAQIDNRLTYIKWTTINDFVEEAIYPSTVKMNRK